MLFFVLAGAWICIQYVPAMVSVTSPLLPSTVVADKMAGQGLTLFIIVLSSPVQICNSMALGFILFRLFDVLKLWPHTRLQASLPLGLNILGQSLIAGLYGGLAAILLLPTSDKSLHLLLKVFDDPASLFFG